jgi:Tol biopolymer transport system component
MWIDASAVSTDTALPYPAISHRQSAFGKPTARGLILISSLILIALAGCQSVTAGPPTSTPAPAPTASPTFVRSAEQKIAFASDLEGSYDIYTMNPDGSAITRLTDDPHDDRFPSWSPDGMHIAFSSNRNGNYEIYVMAADGSGLAQLTHNAGPDWRPDWSPDGTRIAYISYRRRVWSIYAMNPDGSAMQRVVANIAWDAARYGRPTGRGSPSQPTTPSTGTSSRFTSTARIRCS